MTSQQQADEALQAYWQAKKLLDDCFSFPTREEYDRTLLRVSEALQCPEIIGSQSQSLSPAHSLLEC